MRIDNTKIKKYLIMGLLGALITVVGEMLQGFVPSIDTADKIAKLFSSFDNLPVWRLGLGSTIGALGIFMQFFGVYGVYLTFDNKDSQIAKVYKYGTYVYSILGAIVHVLLSMMIYVYKMNMSDGAWVLLDFTLWFVMPIVALFFIGYIPFGITMFVQVLKGHTPFPKWFCVFNPFIGKLLFNAVTAFLPSCALVNGISFSNMGLSAVIIFATFLLFSIMNKREKILDK